jgi:hypothetical protein
MYVHSLITLHNISVDHPVNIAGSNTLHLYAKESYLYTSIYDPIEGATTELITSIDINNLADHGLVYYRLGGEGGRNKFRCLPPNTTSTKLVLSSYIADGSVQLFEWVDIDDWLPTLPDVYWSKNEYGIYPTTVSDSVAIGIASVNTTNPYKLYVYGSCGIFNGSVYVNDGHIVNDGESNIIGNYKGYLITNHVNAIDILLDSGSVTLNHLFAYLIPNDLGSIGEVSYIGARSIENSLNDTGYGFKRDKNTTLIAGNTTLTINFDSYELEKVTCNANSLITFNIVNPIVNKIYTLQYTSNGVGDDIALPSYAKLVSGSFYPGHLNYIQIMCIEASPIYLVTISQESGELKKDGLSITELLDVPSSYSAYKDTFMRVNSTGTSIVFSSLLGGTMTSTNGYVPSWNGTSGCFLNDGYAISSSLYIDYTDSYLATADVIKYAIDTNKVQSVSTSSTIDSDTKVILVDKTSGNITLTFPDLTADGKARVWKIKDISSSDNNNVIVIEPAGVHTIEGQSTFTIEGNGFARDIIFVTNYYIA